MFKRLISKVPLCSSRPLFVLGPFFSENCTTSFYIDVKIVKHYRLLTVVVIGGDHNRSIFCAYRRGRGTRMGSAYIRIQLYQNIPTYTHKSGHLVTRRCLQVSTWNHGQQLSLNILKISSTALYVLLTCLCLQTKYSGSSTWSQRNLSSSLYIWWGRDSASQGIY